MGPISASCSFSVVYKNTLLFTSFTLSLMSVWIAAVSWIIERWDIPLLLCSSQVSALGEVESYFYALLRLSAVYNTQGIQLQPPPIIAVILHTRGCLCIYFADSNSEWRDSILSWIKHFFMPDWKDRGGYLVIVFCGIILSQQYDVSSSCFADHWYLWQDLHHEKVTLLQVKCRLVDLVNATKQPGYKG